MKNIGIIGCGWLGLELGKKWIANDWQVRGTSRSEKSVIELQKAGISAFNYVLGSDLDVEFFKQLDLVVISLPISNKNTIQAYKSLISLVNQHKENQTCILFTSSISVYNQLEGMIDENMAIKDRSSINFQVEELLRKSFKQQLTIVRLGGLISEDRHPINSLAGRENLQNGTEVINLVHRNDVILMIEEIVSKNAFGHVYNCVYPFHPLKSVYYLKEAEKRGLKAPTFELTVNQQRIIDSSKSEEELNFTYQFPI